VVVYAIKFDVIAFEGRTGVAYLLPNYTWIEAIVFVMLRRDYSNCCKSRDVRRDVMMRLVTSGYVVSEFSFVTYCRILHLLYLRNSDSAECYCDIVSISQ